MKHRRAHPLRALMSADHRMLWRQGVAPIYLLLTLLYIAALRFLVPEALKPRISALLLLTDPAVLSLFFMGAIVLYEKNQHVFAALYAAGVKPRACVFSKCAVMSLWGALVGCVIAWFSNPAVLVWEAGAPVWASLLAGDVASLGVTAVAMLLLGVLFTCLSLMLCAFIHSLNGFLLAGVAAELLFLAPAVYDLFFGLPGWAGYHPVVWLSRALCDPAAVVGWVRSPGQWAHLAALLLLLTVAGRGACAAVGRLLRGGREGAL